MSAPRPILKNSRKSSSTDNAGSPPRSPSSVHFTECLTTTYLTHGSVDYNRSPIHVTPNECAMPRRGCPDRTYSTDSTQWSLDVDGPHYIDDSEESDSSNSSDSYPSKRSPSKPSNYSYPTYSIQKPQQRTYNFDSGRDDHWGGCLGGF
ncbi:hypothetical protein FRC02_004649 [Tulasnella sp. 418]|nr:hypothetical protein FRC02_004649 [Tulasnella sp. 418]